MASVAWRVVVGAVSTPVLVPRCGGTLQLPAPPLVLVLVLVLAASPSKRPRAPAPALAVALTPRALALQRVVALMPRAQVLRLAFAPARALLHGPRAALGSVLPGPYDTAGSRHRRSSGSALYGSDRPGWTASSAEQSSVLLGRPKCAAIPDLPAYVAASVA